MNAAQKTFLTIIAAIFFAALLAALSGCAAIHPAKAAQTVIMPDGSAMTPEQVVQFLRDYDEWKQVVDRVAAARSRIVSDTQRDADLADGMRGRLQSQVPPGFQFDATRRVFIRLAQPSPQNSGGPIPPVAATAPPTPAPPAPAPAPGDQAK